MANCSGVCYRETRHEPTQVHHLETLEGRRPAVALRPARTGHPAPRPPRPAAVNLANDLTAADFRQREGTSSASKRSRMPSKAPKSCDASWPPWKSSGNPLATPWPLVAVSPHCPPGAWMNPRQTDPQKGVATGKEIPCGRAGGGQGCPLTSEKSCGSLIAERSRCRMPQPNKFHNGEPREPPNPARP